MKRWFIIGVLLAADRGLKQLALHGFEWSMPGFHFTLFKNSDLVFSLPSGPAVALMIMVAGCLVLAGLAVHTYRTARHVFEPVMLMLAGAFANLYDRIVYGFVADWAYLGPWWPVFNLADVMVMSGLVWYLFKRQESVRTKGLTK